MLSYTGELLRWERKDEKLNEKSVCEIANYMVKNEWCDFSVRGQKA